MQIEYESFGFKVTQIEYKKMMNFHDHAKHTSRKFIKTHNNILFRKLYDDYIVYA